MLNELAKIKDWTLDLLFPILCINCGKEGKYICDDCSVFLSENAQICPVCQKASFSGERHEYCPGRNNLDGLISVWDYDGVIKKLLHKIKYEGVPHAIDEIVKSSFLEIVDNEVRYKDFLSFILSGGTRITYIPAYQRKEKYRGFNQAKIIAKTIADMTKKETIELLEKIKDTPPQVDLKREERLANVKESFRLKKELVCPEKVLLIDDVWTSGATMTECARVLRIAGAKNIWGFTIARTI